MSMDNYIPEKTKPKAVTVSQLEIIEKTDAHAHNFNFKCNSIQAIL